MGFVLYIPLVAAPLLSPTPYDMASESKDCDSSKSSPEPPQDELAGCEPPPSPEGDTTPLLEDIGFQFGHVSKKIDVVLYRQIGASTNAKHWLYPDVEIPTALQRYIVLQRNELEHLVFHEQGLKIDLAMNFCPILSYELHDGAIKRVTLSTRVLTGASGGSNVAKSFRWTITLDGEEFLALFSVLRSAIHESLIPRAYVVVGKGEIVA